MEQCDRHGEITKCLEDHGQRIRTLEVSDTETKTEMKNLIKQVERLIVTIEAFMKTTQKKEEEKTKNNTAWVIGGMRIAIVLLVGFLIWYIQTL